MKAPAAARRRDRRTRRRRRPTPPLSPGMLSSWALLLTGAGLGASAGVDLFDGGHAAAGLALVGFAAAGGGLLARRRAALPRTDGRPPGRPEVLRAVGTAWMCAIAVSTVAYLVIGAFDGFGSALFESVSGFTTTGLTVSPSPEDLPAGVLAWRALSQWLGGGGVIVISATILPVLGGEILGFEQPLRGAAARTWARRVTLAYLAFTAATSLAYFLAGMGAADAAAHGLTTVSTGGFSTTAEPLSTFGPAVVWVAALSMTLAGVNLAVVVWGWRGMRRPLHRSVELRVYLLIILVATGLFLTRGGASGGVRTALFAAASAASTTGLRAVEWGEWSHAAHTGVFVLVAVGAMAGSAGGGFRVMRALAAAGYVRRELVRQLYPRAVVAVRVEGEPLRDAALDQTAGMVMVFLAVVTSVAMIVVIPAGSVESALDATVAAITTAGPALGDPGELAALSASGAAQAGLMAAMLAGRLSLEVLAGMARFSVRRPRALRSRLAGARRS